jgi:hypothetical protein
VACKQDLSSRRPDSNRGPLHYEGRTSEGRASTRGHARALSRWKLSVLELSRRTRVPARARADVPVSYLVQPPHDAISNRRPCARMLSSSRSATTSRVVLVPKGRFPRAAAGRGSSTSGERRAASARRMAGPPRGGAGHPQWRWASLLLRNADQHGFRELRGVARGIGGRGRAPRSPTPLSVKGTSYQFCDLEGAYSVACRRREVSNGRFGAHRRVPLRDHLG